MANLANGFVRDFRGPPQYRNLSAIFDPAKSLEKSTARNYLGRGKCAGDIRPLKGTYSSLVHAYTGNVP
jgi:hypothetical protein